MSVGNVNWDVRTNDQTHAPVTGQPNALRASNTMKHNAVDMPSNMAESFPVFARLANKTQPPTNAHLRRS